jgi:uncharacterized protein (TIGR03118 family)
MRSKFTLSMVSATFLFLGSSFLLEASQSTNSGSNAYVETDLVCDDAYYTLQGYNETNKPGLMKNGNMIDSWGIGIRPPGAGGHFWIANAMSGTVSEYIGDVNGVPLHQDGLKVVSMDLPRWTDHGFAVVTGLAYNVASDIKGQPIEFPVSGPADDRSTNPPAPISGGTSGSAAFAFVTEDGCVNAWRQNTKVAMQTAPLIINYSKTSVFPYHANCVFSGCALTTNAYTTDAFAKLGGNHLFATDFRSGAIQVFDNKWKDVTSSYHFETPKDVKDLHAFNIADLGGHLFVTYALFTGNSDEGMEEEDGRGPGFGHLVEYDETGKLIKDFKDKGMLNAPWGLAIAPPTFGKFGGNLIVANLGDGTIAAFDLKSGRFLDQLKDDKGNVISIDRIWGITFGNGVSLGDANSLYFVAGPNNETCGLFGKLTVAAAAPKSAASPQSTPAVK